MPDGGTPPKSAPDLAVALPAHCPCPLNSYCDLATNSCEAGCLGDDHCAPGYRCDTKAYQCILVCDPDAGCENHLVCEQQENGFYTCHGCEYGYDDCNHDPADGCETPLDTDANCGECGGAPDTTCFQDKDKDHYVLSLIKTMHCGSCPTGQTASSETKPGEDCNDNDPRVHPGQTAYSTTPTSTGGWDFDCDGFVEKYQQFDVFQGCSPDDCNSFDQWTSVPADCGEFGDITRCLNPIGGECHSIRYTNSSAQSCR
jgi:hypothetical protein